MRAMEAYWLAMIDHKRQAQRIVIDRVAKDLGVVAFRPDYYAKDGDKNTVLFYTKDDHKKNVELERSGEMITSYEAHTQGWKCKGIEDKVERPYFFWFENSDVNGMFDMDYANYGKLRLVYDPYKVIYEAVKNALQIHLDKKGVSNGSATSTNV